MRIPVTMCHGIRPEGRRNSQGLTSKPLTVDHLDRLIGIVADHRIPQIERDGLDGAQRQTSLFWRRNLTMPLPDDNEAPHGGHAGFTES